MNIKRNIKKNHLLIGVLIIILGISTYWFVGHHKEEKLLESSYGLGDKETSLVIIDTDYPEFDSSVVVYDAADTVIFGKILSYKDEVIDISMSADDIDLLDNLTDEEKAELKKVPTEPEYFPYRIFDLEITETFKGDHQVGDIIQVKQLYGEMDDYFYDNPALLEKETDYLLFLNDYPNSPSTLLNENQAAYLADDNLLKNEQLQPLLKSENSLNLTKEILQEISEK